MSLRLHEPAGGDAADGKGHVHYGRFGDPGPGRAAIIAAGRRESALSGRQLGRLFFGSVGQDRQGIGQQCGEAQFGGAHEDGVMAKRADA